MFQDHEIAWRNISLITNIGLIACLCQLGLGIGLSLPGIPEGAKNEAYILSAISILLPILGFLMVKIERALGISAIAFGTGACAAAWLGSGWSSAAPLFAMVLGLSGIGFVAWTLLRATKEGPPRIGP